MSEECCNADKSCSKKTVHIHTIVIKIFVQENTIYSKMPYTQKVFCLGQGNRSLERSGSVQWSQGHRLQMSTSKSQGAADTCKLSFFEWCNVLLFCGNGSFLIPQLWEISIDQAIENIFVVINYYVVLLLCFFFTWNMLQRYTSLPWLQNQCDYVKYSVSDSATDCQNRNVELPRSRAGDSPAVYGKETAD